MTAHNTVQFPSPSKLALVGGGFAMVAIDQRESLRRMFPLVNGEEVDDETLRKFKSAAIAALSPIASAVLLDRHYGLADRRPAELAKDTALVLAADDLYHPLGQPVLATSLDPFVTEEYAQQVGADALKLLVIWQEDGSSAEREDLVGSFLDLAQRVGTPSLLEGIVRPARGGQWLDHHHRHEAILRAAAELSGYGCSIYKAEVPGYIQGDVSLVREQSERLTALLRVPWVVLSNGVAQAEFARAMVEAVEGGASGFLAGRAVWSDTVRDEQPAAALRERAVPRLRGLRASVSEATSRRIAVGDAFVRSEAGKEGSS